jgi:hypothetical protein
MTDTGFESSSKTYYNAAFVAPTSDDTISALGTFADSILSGSNVVSATSASTTTPQPTSSTPQQCCNIACRMSSRHMKLFGIFLHSYEALIVGDSMEKACRVRI